MALLSPVLRSVVKGHAHWCPGCGSMHRIPDRWTFDGNVNQPTFGPSVKIEYNGSNAGEEGPDGERMTQACCHYFLKAGKIEFQGDCTHGLKGQTVDLPALPPGLDY